MNRLVAGIIAFVVVAAIVIGAVVFFIMRDDESDEGDAREVAVSTAPVVRADAVVVPIRSASLGMPSGGMVSDVLVRENDAVEEGQLLVRLDATNAEIAIERAENALASARADMETLNVAIEKERELDDEARPGRLEQARSALQGATERYLHLSGANRRPGASVSAEGAVLEANYAEAIARAEFGVEQAAEAVLIAMGVERTAEIASTADSRAHVAVRDARIAKARLAIVDLQNALEDARDFEKITGDAQDAVTVATALLANAERDLEVTVLKTSEANRVTQDAYNDAEYHWRSIHNHYLGIELTSTELHKDPATLFAEWGVDLESVFDRDNLSFPNNVLEDDPATRWNELKVFGMLGLGPYRAHMVTCQDILVPRGMRCIEREYEDAWFAFSAARETYITTEKNGQSALQAAENRIVTARNQLEDAERALEIAQSARPQASATSIQSELDATNAALNALLDYPDDGEVAQAEANLEVARATLADLHPDAQELALARQQVEDAELQVAKLVAGRDPLDEERREARLAAAATRVTSMETALEAAQIALTDTELRAPFGGTVTSLNVDAGEEVGPRQVVMSLADTSEWELVTVDLDELSVVNLAEGDNVMVSFDALPELEMSGTISRISRFGEEIKGAVTYSADVRLSGTDPRLRWGMTASIRK